jgi:predicted RNA binding protein with dsRBD fold (UPF0201 family)
MENNVEKAIKNFVDEPEVQEQNEKDENVKKVVLKEREGLIERVDKVLVTRDGKQLLREWY